MLTSGVVARGFKPRFGKSKEYNISICCFSAAISRKSKDWLTRNQNNVSKWSDKSTRGLLFQCASTIKLEAQVSLYRSPDINKSS